MLRLLALSIALSTLVAPASASDVESADLRVVLNADSSDEEVVTDVGTFVALSEGSIILVRPADSVDDAVDTWADDGSVVSKLILRNRDAGERVVLWDVSVVAAEEDANGNQFLSLSGLTSDPDAGSSWDISDSGGAF